MDTGNTDGQIDKEDFVAEAVPVEKEYNGFTPFMDMTLEIVQTLGVIV